MQIIKYVTLTEKIIDSKEGLMIGNIEQNTSERSY